MIQVTDLSFSFGLRNIFSRLNFNISRGEIFSIIGPNGCGKSTLLRLLRGTLKPAGGKISWDDIPLQHITAKEMAKRVAVVPQSSTLTFPYTVRELVAMGRYSHRKNLFSLHDKTDLEAIEQALRLADIHPLAQRPVTQLSGGEQQRVLLARALAQNSTVLFLDEATSHLDIDHKLELTELLIRLNQQQQTTVVQVSHDLDLAAAISHRMLLLAGDGRIVALGDPETVMTKENLCQLFRFNIEITHNSVTGTPQVTPCLNLSPTKIRFDSQNSR